MNTLIQFTAMFTAVDESKKYVKIRTQIQTSEPKREITNITNSQNTKRTYDQPSEQLFPKRWPLSNQNRTKNNNTLKVKRHRNSDIKTDNRVPQQNYRIGTVSNELLGGGGGGVLNYFACTTSPSVSEVIQNIYTAQQKFSMDFFFVLILVRIRNDFFKL